MKVLEINIKRDGVYKTFKTLKKVTTEVLLQSLELEKRLDHITDLHEFLIDSLTFICEVFEHQFTEKELSRSVEYEDILPLLNKVMDHVILKMDLKTYEEQFEVGEVVPFESRKRNKG